MLVPAAQNLSSPCLPEGWNSAYEGWAYLFVVISIVLMQLVDYLIEGAYQSYIERTGSQPHVEACHEQAHDEDQHTHHAAVVGAIVSMHSSQARLHAHTHDHGSSDSRCGDHQHGDSDHSGPSSAKAASDVEAGQAGGEPGEEGGEGRRHTRRRPLAKLLKHSDVGSACTN
jgi:hypothetical protein